MRQVQYLVQYLVTVVREFSVSFSVRKSHICGYHVQWPYIISSSIAVDGSNDKRDQTESTCVSSELCLRKLSYSAAELWHQFTPP